MNANGRIPVLQVGDRFIPESNAACYFVAEGSNLIPTERFDHADMLRWMFWEQYNHEPNIATLRFWMHYLGADNLTDLQQLQMTPKRNAGNAALKLMDEHLGRREWFVGDMMSLADICLFAYTHVAGDADFELKAYPRKFLSWVERIKGHPHYLPLTPERPCPGDGAGLHRPPRRPLREGAAQFVCRYGDIPVAQPLMPHATAAWLVDNCSLTFEQIAEFCGLHILEIQAIADDTAATKLTGRDPVRAGELTHEEIEKGQKDPDISSRCGRRPKLSAERRDRAIRRSRSARTSPTESPGSSRTIQR